MNRFITLQTLDDAEEINSFKKWGLILSNKENTPPAPKTTYVDIQGGDGSLDLSEAFGEIKYNDRTITYTFSMLDKFLDLPQKISDVANDINGRQFKITHYDDPDYYYIGRLTINEFKVDRAKGTITVDAVCNPYKYKKYITTHSLEVYRQNTLICPNDKKSVVPTITTTNEMIIEFEGNEYVVSAGTHEILNISFKRGLNELKITGAGTITVTYQECSL